MSQLWTVLDDSLELQEMPFFWRLSDGDTSHGSIPNRLPIRIHCLEELDLLQYSPTSVEEAALTNAYRQDANIGFLQPGSGQISTYGASVNRFFLEVIDSYRPKRIFEIGCGAGLSITFLRDRGWNVVGIDPSDYSRRWSERLGFTLLNSFFANCDLKNYADLIFCNDVFEHVSRVEEFAEQVFRALLPGGVFCFATTNSTRSIQLGDISMLEHQHVNMFTQRSIELVLKRAGFGSVMIRNGTYGNTFNVVAIKGGKSITNLAQPTCPGFFERANTVLQSFSQFYDRRGFTCNYYVPLRCIPYLSAVGDFGRQTILDSNPAWRRKFIDGYTQPIRTLEDLQNVPEATFFIGSLTFFDEIKRNLVDLGCPPDNIYSVRRLLDQESS